MTILKKSVKPKKLQTKNVTWLTHFSSIGSILMSITTILRSIVTIFASIEQVNTPLNIRELNLIVNISKFDI